MKIKLFSVLILLSALQLYGSDNYKRNTSVDIINYSFSISVSDSNNIVYGHSVVTFMINSNLNTLVFDLKNKKEDGKGMTVKNVTFDKGSVNWIHEGDRVIITSAAGFEAGIQGIITIDYFGIPSDGLIISDNKFGKRTFFADNWPDRARNWIPCVDHPSDKATVDFIVTAPDHYEVVGSGYLVEESCMPGHTKLTHWKEEVPLATKVMAIGIADFAARYEGIVNQTPVWTWVFTQNRNEGFNDYAVGLKPIAFYSTLIGPYSYEKLANVQSKTIFGGLENAGCIFYAENSVTGKNTAESLMAHEIAHQWFGNSVTENDWHDIWLSEGFATYLTNVYLENTYGEAKFVQSLKVDRDRVVRYSKRLMRPVIDTTVTDLMRLLNPNSYQKGSWVLHMLRREMGDEKFWNGIREFYSTYRNKNATTSDFERIMETASKKDLSGFFKQWLYTAGQPDLKITTRNGRKAGTTELVIEQLQDHLFLFDIELKVNDSQIIKVPVSDKITVAQINSGNVTSILADPEVDLLFSIAGGSDPIVRVR